MRISNKVFSESYQVLSMLDEGTKEKIPSDIWSLLELNSDKSLYFDYNKDASLDKQPMSRETKALLISIYRDYLCDAQTKQEINAALTKNANSRCSTVGDETNIINLINIQYANEGLKAKEESKDLAIIEKQSLISKIFAKIKKLFKGQKVEEDNII